jgi:aromatic ring hydroxylase
VRGARVLATLAPYADEQTVYPSQPIPPEATEYALAFAVPLDTPGLKFLCRDSASAPGADPFDKPLSSRFDEQDAFCTFDDVLVPWEREDGVWFPNGAPLEPMRAMLPVCMPRAAQLITLIGSHNLLTTPSRAQLGPVSQ